MRTMKDKNKKLPVIMGTEVFARKNINTSESLRILEAGINAGFTGIDTAECYGDGKIEKIIGSIPKESLSDSIICTKFGHCSTNIESPEPFSLDLIKKQLNQSLMNMKCKVIDVYYFHSGSNDDFRQPKVWEYLQTQKEDGLIIELGLSLKHELVKKEDYFQIQNARDFGVSVLQTVLNPFNQHSLKYLIDFAHKSNLLVVGRMPLSKGLVNKATIAEIEKYVTFEKDIFDRVEDYWKRNLLPADQLSMAIKIGGVLNWALKEVDLLVMAASSLQQMQMNISVAQAISIK